MRSVVLFSIVITAASGSWLASAIADDPAERFIREAQNRAEYWKARGYEFNPFLMSAESMDRHVENVKRAAYWRERGFQFDPEKMTAWAMDRKAEATLRAAYWKRWGIEFDAEMMDAETMDDAAVKLKQVQAKLDELKEKQGEQPAIVIDQAAAEILAEPPKVKGAKQTPRQRPAPAAPSAPQIPLMIAGMGGAGGLGGRGGGGGRGNVGSAANGPQIGNGGGSRGSGNGLQIPPGVDPEEFFDFLRRLESGF